LPLKGFIPVRTSAAPQIKILLLSYLERPSKAWKSSLAADLHMALRPRFAALLQLSEMEQRNGTIAKVKGPHNFEYFFSGYFIRFTTYFGERPTNLYARY